MNNVPRFPLQWPAGWPRTKSPVRSRFGTSDSKPTIAQASEFLEHEIKLLTGDSKFVISTNLKYKQDGFPYSNQKDPEDQGAAVYFTHNKKDFVIACDSFNKVGCNLYAIGKTIEAMRGIERWGCSELMNRAFTGFQALPEKGSATTWYDFMDLPEDAGPEQIKARYRELAKKMHPDAGGSTTMFQMLNELYNKALEQFESAS